MPRPISATVHLDALAHNLSVIRSLTPHSKIWAVVKANAYGHHLSLAWQGLQQTDGFALLDLQEAISLREAGWRGPILLLEGVFTAEDLQIVDRYQLTMTVHDPFQIKLLQSATLSQPVNVCLKLNSGMNRLGFTPQQYLAAWHTLLGDPRVGEIILMTHFSDADTEKGVAQAVSCYEHTWRDLPGARCVANSAAVLWHPQTRQEWVRPGIVLYGASPSGRSQDIAEYGFQAAMSLHSELIGTQNLKKGDTVGYSSRYTAIGSQRIGVVACGYADGYPRHAPTGTPVWVDGVRTHLVGNISMDMLTVDLTPCPHAGVGSKVELWGAHLPVDEVAQAAGTLGYELLTAVTQRVPFQSI